MTEINVDFEVFKAITARRRTEDMTENDVLRELFELPINSRSSTKLDNAGGNPWLSKSVSFPHGTQFRASYKGQQYTATVKNGVLVMDGKPQSSLSAAAVSITGNPVNGWRFWEYLQPNSTEWKLAASLRD